MGGVCRTVRPMAGERDGDLGVAVLEEEEAACVAVVLEAEEAACGAAVFVLEGVGAVAAVAETFLRKKNYGTGFCLLKICFCTYDTYNSRRITMVLKWFECRKCHDLCEQYATSVFKCIF